MSTFTDAFGFCASLTADLTTSSDCIELDAAATARLCGTLGTDKYTRLVFNTTAGYGEIKVSCVNGKLTLEAGHGQELPAGEDVFFDWSPANMADWYKCMQEAEDEADSGTSDIDVKSDSLNVGFDDNGVLCIETKDATESELKWVYCNKEFYVEDGKVKVRPASDVQADATFLNATVTLINGKPTYSQGSAVMVQNSKCCKCETTDDP